MKRLIVVTNSAYITSAVRNELTTFFEAKGWSVWHWFQDLWLLDNVPTETKSSELRDEIRAAIPGLKHIIILGADGTNDHSGFVPTESIPWIKVHWQKR